jgi:methionyl-tRNA synthetase
LLEAIVNNDLADHFGDLANRTLTFVATWFQGAIPEGRGEVEAEKQLERELDQHLNALRRYHASYSLRKAADEVRSIWRLANGYLAQAPWVMFRTDPERCRVAVRTAVNLVEICATVAWPFIPNSAEAVLRALGRPPGVPAWREPVADVLRLVETGCTIQAPPLLFRKLTWDWAEEQRNTFRGSHDPPSL